MKNNDFSALDIDKIRLIKLFTIAGAAVLYLVALMHYVSGDTTMSAFEALIATGALFNLLLLKVSGNVRLSEDFILFGMILLLSAVLIHGGYEKTGIYWIYTFPLVSFFLKGNKTGFIWNGAFFVIAAVIVYLSYAGVVPIAYSYSELRQAALAYIIVTILAYIYEDALLKSYREVSRLAVTDQLTGLYNRRYIFRKLEEEIERSRRYGTDLCVILLDVDDFKNINDRYGHDVGDVVLKSIADILRSNTRNVDTVGRLGGEEFVIICPETDAFRGRVVAEKIRKSVEELQVLSLPKISISVGVADFRGYEGPAELLKKADIALYKAKRSGKNRVVVFPEKAIVLKPGKKIKKPAL
ncbi:GGDEF domain-containing protein [Persephonella sp.]